MERLLPFSLHCQRRLLRYRLACPPVDGCSSAATLVPPSASDSPCRAACVGVAAGSLAPPASQYAPLISAPFSPTPWQVGRFDSSKARKPVDLYAVSTATANLRRFSATANTAMRLECNCARSVAGDVLVLAAETINSAFTLEVACGNRQRLSVRARLLPPHHTSCCREDTTVCVDADAITGETRCKKFSACSPFQLSFNSVPRSPHLTLRHSGAALMCSSFWRLSAASGAETRSLLHHNGHQRRFGHRHFQSACMSWRYQQRPDGEPRSCLRWSGKNCIQKSGNSLRSSGVCTPKACYTLGGMSRTSRFGESAASHLSARSPLWFPAGERSRYCFFTSAGNSRSDTRLCEAKAEATKGRAVPGEAALFRSCHRHHQNLWEDTEEVIYRESFSRSCKRSTGNSGCGFPASRSGGARYVAASDVAASTSAASAQISSQMLGRRFLSLNSNSSAEKNSVAVPESHYVSRVERRDAGEALPDGATLSELQPYAGNEAVFLKERYGPPKDPSTLLIEPHRLTKEERFFQKLFVALPGVALLMMLATPVALVRYHVRKLQERMACTEEVAEELASELWGPPFQDCDFPTLRNVIEQPTHAFVFYFHPESLSSQVVRPLLRDIADLFRKLRIRVMVAAVDLADKSVPDAMRRMFPVALAPHGELLLPYGFNGQQPALQLYDGEWEAQNIVRALVQEVPAAAAALAAAKELNDWAESLSDCVFALRFVDDRPGDEMGTHERQGESWYSSVQGSSDIAAAAAADRFVEERARAIGLAKGGLREALRECESAREKLRLMVQQRRLEGSQST